MEKGIKRKLLIFGNKTTHFDKQKKVCFPKMAENININR
jgi:hypothetical protein